MKKNGLNLNQSGILLRVNWLSNNIFTDYINFVPIFRDQYFLR